MKDRNTNLYEYTNENGVVCVTSNPFYSGHITRESVSLSSLVAQSFHENQTRIRAVVTGFIPLKEVNGKMVRA